MCLEVGRSRCGERLPAYRFDADQGESGAQGRALLRPSPWGRLAAGEHGQTPPVAKGLERTPTSLVR